MAEFTEGARYDAMNERGDTMLILVAVGANLPGPWGDRPITTCLRAVQEVASLPGLRLQAVSAWYGSAAMPPSGQPDYVNGVIRLQGTAQVEPAWLLSALHRIEAAAGRVRSVANAARSLDLDLLAVGDVIRPAGVEPGSGPVLPHPRLAERSFVLQPLRDVCPDWVDPRDGRTVEALIAALEAAPGPHGCGAASQPLLWNIPQR